MDINIGNVMEGGIGKGGIRRLLLEGGIALRERMLG